MGFFCFPEQGFFCSAIAVLRGPSSPLSRAMINDSACSSETCEHSSPSRSTASHYLGGHSCSSQSTVKAQYPLAKVSALSTALHHGPPPRHTNQRKCVEANILLYILHCFDACLSPVLQLLCTVCTPPCLSVHLPALYAVPLSRPSPCHPPFLSQCLCICYKVKSCGGIH